MQAEALCPCGYKACLMHDWPLRKAPEVLRLRMENDLLRFQLIKAAEKVEEWGAYASDYFQQKHDLAGVVAEIRESAKPKELS